MIKLASFVALVMLATVPLMAGARHEITYKGTVVSADDKKVVVTVVNEKTRKPEAMTFKHDAETKILREDKVVTYAQAKIVKGEKIAVTINHDDLPEFAVVIRLDAKK